MEHTSFLNCLEQGAVRMLALVGVPGRLESAREDVDDMFLPDWVPMPIRFSFWQSMMLVAPAVLYSVLGPKLLSPTDWFAGFALLLMAYGGYLYWHGRRMLHAVHGSLALLTSEQMAYFQPDYLRYALLEIAQSFAVIACGAWFGLDAWGLLPLGLSQLYFMVFMLLLLNLLGYLQRCRFISLLESSVR